MIVSVDVIAVTVSSTPYLDIITKIAFYVFNVKLTFLAIQTY